MELYAEFNIRCFESTISAPGPYLLKAVQILGGHHQSKGLEAVLDEASLRKWSLEPGISLPGRILEITFGTYRIIPPWATGDPFLTNEDLVMESLREIKERAIPYVGPVEEDGVLKPFRVTDTTQYVARLITKGEKVPVHAKVPYYDFDLQLSREEYRAMMEIPLHETVMRIKGMRLRNL